MIPSLKPSPLELEPRSDASTRLETQTGTAQLPWSGAPVRLLSGLAAFFGKSIGGDAARYLPRTISLFVESQVPDGDVGSFLEGAADQLRQELRVRAVRCAKFSAVGGISAEELETFLTGRTDAQPWALYLSRAGGLGHTAEVTSERSRGVIPCSTMRNHGVAWEHTAGGVDVWLATARKEGQEWDWESDIGHESAHAAFAPVPLFVQGEPVSLASVRGVEELKPGHIARICYLLSELAVVAIRGEVRETETHLPIADRDELFALLSLCDELDPSAGFSGAMDAARRVDGAVDPNEGDTIFEVARPVVRVLPRLAGLTRAFVPPDLARFRHALCVQ